MGFLFPSKYDVRRFKQPERKDRHGFGEDPEPEIVEVEASVQPVSKDIVREVRGTSYTIEWMFKVSGDEGLRTVKRTSAQKADEVKIDGIWFGIIKATEWTESSIFGTKKYELSTLDKQ